LVSELGVPLAKSLVFVINKHRHETTFGWWYPTLDVAYLDIPKVASTSIKAALTTAAGSSDAGARVALGQLGISSAAFTFAFVRNPWDRLVSCWSDKIRDPNRTDREYVNGVYRDFLVDRGTFWGGMDFRDFVHAILSTPDSDSDIHVRSQSWFFREAGVGPEGIFVGRFEQLSSDWAEVCESVQQAIHLPHLNYASPRPQPRGNYVNSYDAELRRLVAVRYAEDTELFRYRFEIQEGMDAEV
jgi:hypothetical protein